MPLESTQEVPHRYSQKTDTEHKSQTQFLPHRYFQSPKDRHRQNNDTEIEEEIHCSCNEKSHTSVAAMSMNGRIPIKGQGLANQSSNQYHHHKIHHNKPQENIGVNTEFPVDTKEFDIKIEYRDFDTRVGWSPRKLSSEEKLLEKCQLQDFFANDRRFIPFQEVRAAQVRAQ